LLRLARAESSPKSPLAGGLTPNSLHQRSRNQQSLKPVTTPHSRSPLSALPASADGGKRASSAIPVLKSSPKDQRAYLAMSEMVRDMDKAVSATRSDSENIR
jgi:hypothetical protein